MEEKIFTWVKQPVIIRSIYFITCMVGSFGMGIFTHAFAVNSKNTPIIKIPEQPLPSVYRYKESRINNPYDDVVAIPVIENDNREIISETQNTQISIEKKFVASKTGTKYYPLDCGGVNRIKEENKIYFTTEQEAINKGYERTSTCQ